MGTLKYDIHVDEFTLILSMTVLNNSCILNERFPLSFSACEHNSAVKFYLHLVPLMSSGIMPHCTSKETFCRFRQKKLKQKVNFSLFLKLRIFSYIVLQFENPLWTLKPGKLLLTYKLIYTLTCKALKIKYV